MGRSAGLAKVNNSQYFGHLWPEVPVSGLVSVPAQAAQGDPVPRWQQGGFAKP
jgi:hypothetical protein